MSVARRAAAVLASLLSALSLGVAAQMAPPAGMVLDLQGAGQLTANGATTRLQLLTRLAPGARIELPEGGRASITLYASRAVYRVTGPSVLEVGTDQLKVISGAAPEVRNLGEKQAALAQPTSAVAGAYRMRSLGLPQRVTLAAPENGSVLLDARPEFRWEAAGAPGVTFTLKAEAGSLNYSTQVAGDRLRLPDTVKLEHGRSYDWTVSYPGSNGETHAASGKFSLASQAESEQFAQLKPADADPIEDWVFYANLLQQRQIRAEARAAWQHIAKRRPDLERAAELARLP